MREEDKLDDDVYMQQFHNADHHYQDPEIHEPDGNEAEQLVRYAAQQQQQAPQQGQFGAGPMGQQFGLAGVPQAQAAMVPAPQPMQPMQQTAQQATMLPGTPISAMT